MPGPTVSVTRTKRGLSIRLALTVLGVRVSKSIPIKLK